MNRQTRVYAIYVADKIYGNPVGNPIARFTTTEPADWDEEMSLFHKNESTWCTSNVFDPGRDESLEVLDPDRWSFYLNSYRLTNECPCGYWNLKLYKQN